MTRNADLNRAALAKVVTGRGVVNGTTETRDLALAYNDFWWDRGTKVVGTRRTSLIVDPPDGRIPSLTTEAESRRQARQEGNQRITAGPEDRALSERCILGFNSGPPMLPGGYNQNVHLFQTPDYVAILNEMVHNVRIVPMDGRPHADLPQWTGESRGRWDGDTLVVETKNFLRETSFRSSSENLNLTERFTRVDADTLLYEFTVEDPTTWERPWSVEVPDAEVRRADVRVRLSRGKLRNGRHAQRSARPRARSSRGVKVSTAHTLWVANYYSARGKIESFESR